MHLAVTISFLIIYILRSKNLMLKIVIAVNIMQKSLEFQNFMIRIRKFKVIMKAKKL